MKKFISTALAFILLTFFISGCSFDKDKLNGSYEANNGYTTAELEIDGDEALITLSGQAMNGSVDRTKKTITFKTEKESVKFNYKIVGNKLSLGTKDTDTIAFEKKKSK